HRGACHGSQETRRSGGNLQKARRPGDSSEVSKNQEIAPGLLVSCGSPDLLISCDPWLAAEGHPAFIAAPVTDRRRRGDQEQTCRRPGDQEHFLGFQDQEIAPGLLVSCGSPDLLISCDPVTGGGGASSIRRGACYGS